MTYPVKWFSSAMQGAPLLSSGTDGAAQTTNPGSLIGLLRAVLVTGFGAQALSAATYDAAAATLTLTLPSAHKYLKDQIIAVSGANESGFNGEFRVKSVSTYTVVLGLDNGTPAAASATGSLVINIPGLGWAVEYEDASSYRIIFKRQDAASTPLRLYVDNSAWSGWNNNSGYLARVCMVEDVVDINTFTLVADYRWPCSHNYGRQEWQLIGDSRLFYFFPAYAAGYSLCRGGYAFGDIQSIRPNDQYHCLLVRYPVTTNDRYWNANSQATYTNFARFADTAHKQLARSHHQLPGAVVASWRGLDTYMGGPLSFPNPADNGFYVSTEPLPVFDDTAYRGTLPGLVVPLATAAAYDQQHLGNLPGLPGRLIRLLLVNREEAAGSGSDYRRLVGFDIKGPWR